MKSRRNISQEADDRPLLLFPRSDVSKKIEELIVKGENLLKREIQRSYDLKIANEELNSWRDYTREYLRQAFTNQIIASEFSKGIVKAKILTIEPRLDLEINEFRRDVEYSLKTLRSIFSRIEIIPEKLVNDDINANNEQVQTERIQITNYGSITNPNIVQGSTAVNQSIYNMNNSISELLKELRSKVAEISRDIPEEITEQFKRDISIIEMETKSKQPRKQIFEISVEGLKKAASDIKDIGKPILEIVVQLLPLLIALSK